MNIEPLKTYRFCHASRKQFFFSIWKPLRLKKSHFAKWIIKTSPPKKKSHFTKWIKNHWKHTVSVTLQENKFFISIWKPLQLKKNTLRQMNRESLKTCRVHCMSCFKKTSFLFSFWKPRLQGKITPYQINWEWFKTCRARHASRKQVFISFWKPLRPKKSHFFLCE